MNVPFTFCNKQPKHLDGEKHVAFSSTSDESNDGEEVKALRAALKEKDQRLSALESKFDNFSNEQKDGSNKSQKKARKNEKECTYWKKAGKWLGWCNYVDHNDSKNRNR